MSAADRLRALGKPTNCVWFFRPESGLHRYVEIDPEMLIAIVEAAERFEQAYREDVEWDQEADELDVALAALDAALGEG